MTKIKIVLAAAGILLLAGCGNKEAKNNPADANPVNQQESQKVENPNADSGIVNSIKEAMGLGKTMKCTYKIKQRDGELETVAYVNGQKYKTQMTVAGNVQYMLFSDGDMYTWSDKDKKGMKMTKACTEEMAKNIPSNGNSVNQQPAPDPTGEKTFQNALDVSCESASDVDFSVPADVAFSDQCEMLKGFMKNIPGGQGMPQGMPRNIPTN